MEQSLFIEWVKKYLPGITIQIVEKLNDTKNPLTYLHRQLLRKEFSVSGKWDSISVANSLVAADVVSMDSGLPLKKRDAISKANGDIAKIGMKMYLNENQLTALDYLVATNATDAQILAKLFADTPKVIAGVYEQLEAQFLEGFSSGVTIVQDTQSGGYNVGTGVRLDYKYPAANKFESSVAFTDSAATPFTDIQPLLDKANADGNPLTKCYLDRATFNGIAKSDEAKELYAASVSFFGANIPVPTFAALNSAVQDRYGFVFIIVDRSVRYEVNGVQTSRKPWKVGSMVFVGSDQVGLLMWARLAEMNHPVNGVEYSTVDDFILVSKYRHNEPAISEFTSSQARVVPVISNVDQIYVLDATNTDAG